LFIPRAKNKDERQTLVGEGVPKYQIESSCNVELDCRDVAIESLNAWWILGVIFKIFNVPFSFIALAICSLPPSGKVHSCRFREVIEDPSFNAIAVASQSELVRQNSTLAKRVPVRTQ
jgi:hypothetical protein